MSYAPIDGNAFLTGLLGQDLAATLLDPSKSPEQDGTASGTLTAREAADEVLLSPEAQSLLKQIGDATLAYTGGKKDDPTYSQYSPKTIAASPNTITEIDGGIAQTDPNASLTNAQTPANVGIFEIIGGSGATRDPTQSQESLYIDRDATGALDISFTDRDSVDTDNAGFAEDTTRTHITIAPNGAVNFDQTISQGTTSYDLAHDRSCTWDSTELDLNDTSAGTVLTITQGEGSAYDSRSLSQRLSSEVKISGLLHGSNALTGADVAVQVLASSKRFSAPGESSQLA